MNIDNRKTLLATVYYTLAILTLCACGFFIYALIVRGAAMWIKIVYFIWSGIVICNLIYDIICTRSSQWKNRSGWLVYILSLAAVVMAIVVYFINTTATGLATDFFNMYLSVSMLSLLTTGYLIATWCVGESLAKYGDSSRNEKRAA